MVTAYFVTKVIVTTKAIDSDVWPPNRDSKHFYGSIKGETIFTRINAKLNTYIFITSTDLSVRSLAATGNDYHYSKLALNMLMLSSSKAPPPLWSRICSMSDSSCVAWPSAAAPAPAAPPCHAHMPAQHTTASQTKPIMKRGCRKVKTKTIRLSVNFF